MKSLQGHLLVASPKLVDPNFHRAVVLMIQHSDEGALGLVLNNPMDVPIEAAWQQVSETPCQAKGLVHKGGPVDGPLMVVHTDDSLSEIEVLPGVQFSTDREAVERLVWQCDCPMKFFVGYAGWGPGQLEGEMEEGSWLVVPATSEQIFDQGDELWLRLMKELASQTMFHVNPKSIPEDPSMN